MKKNYPLFISIALLIASVATSFKNANSQSLTVQTSYNVSDTVKGGGNAGVIFIGTEYWVSKWSQDSIYRLTSSGSLISGFVIPGVTGIRSLTSDGTSVYAGLGTTTIAKINPVTRQLIGTITAPIPARHISYSPSANSGAGGLWIGHNFSDLILIDFSGNTLQTIPTATHGLNRMYGSAYDSIATNGGPFLWIFDQGPSGNAANLVRIPVSTGVPDYTYSVLNDFPIISGGIAGGAYMTYTISAGQKVIVAILQGLPNVLVRYAVPATLPITLASFQGQVKGSKNFLQWTTANEQNNKGFELQRSADGNGFKTITFVPSLATNGNSVKDLNYTYTDVAPIKGNNYYRLKQIDKDGKTSISSTLVLKALEVLKAEISNLYPNPVNSVLNISVNTPIENKITFVITDIKGSPLIKQTSQVLTGNNIFNIKTQSLSTGTYVLKAFGKDGQVIGETKFVKQ